ncbi:hypothetical protein ACFLUP_03305 [Chloroflexota bacterium]
MQIINKKTLNLLIIVLVLTGLLLGAFAVPTNAGAPDDSYTIERYHSENFSALSTTNIAWQNKTTISFTPPNNAYFLLISDCVIGAEFARDPVQARLFDGSTPYNEIKYTPKLANSESSFTSHRVLSLTADTTYTFNNQFSSVGGDNVSIRDSTLTAIQLSDNITAEHNAIQSTTNTDYTDALTLDFTGDGGDYLIIANADTTNSNNTRETITELYYSTGTASWGENIYSPYIGEDYGNFFIFRKLTAASDAQQFKIRYKASGNTASIRNAHISAIDLDDVSDIQYAESEAVSSNSTLPGVFQDKATLTFSPVAEGNYSISMVSLINQSDTGGEIHSAEITDGVNFDTQIYTPDDVATYIVSSHSDVFSVNNTSHTYKTQFKPVSAGTASMKNSRIIAIRMNTCESYFDSAHTTVSDNFTNLTGTLYFWAQGLSTNTDYKVSYYDHDGDKISSDVDVTSNANGTLATEFDLSTDSGAAPGANWRAAVFTSSASPPTTWDAVSGTTGFIMADRFHVEASAIPEFPDLIAAIAVTGSCFAIYIWMRKRRPAYVYSKT